MKNEIDNTTVKDIRNVFRTKKEKKAIKNRTIRDIRNHFEHEEEENRYKPVKVGNSWSNNYIKHENNGDKNKTHQVKNILIKLNHT